MIFFLENNLRFLSLKTDLKVGYIKDKTVRQEKSSMLLMSRIMCKWKSTR